MDNAKFNFYRGDTYTRDFTIDGYENNIDDIYFTVKEVETDKKAKLSKTLGNGITLVDETETSKTYNILINASDTENLKTDFPYFFDIEIITNTNQEPIVKTIIAGTMTLDTDITRAANRRG